MLGIYEYIYYTYTYIYIYICIYTHTKKLGFNVKFLLIDGDNNYYCSINIVLRVSFFVMTLSFLSSVFPDIVM